MKLFACVVTALVLAAPASAENGVFLTEGKMQRNLKAFGLSWNDGTFEAVHYAKCNGIRGQRGNRFARFRCWVIAGGDARRVLTVVPYSEWEFAFRFRQIGYW